MPKPVAVFFAGCNGAGKSTLRDEILRSNQPFIDADFIAKQVNFSHLPNADIAAGREAIRRFRSYLQEKQSFSIETTLSGVSALNNMQKAKDAGFEVHLYYCGLASVELNIARVAERVAQGGHHIAEDIIRRRYVESLRNLKIGLEIADKSMIFDNSLPKERYKDCVMIDKTGSYVLYLPDWLKLYLPDKVIQTYQLAQSQQKDAEFVKQLCQSDFALRKAALHDPEISQALLERTAIHHKCPQTRKAAAAVLQQRGIEIPTSNKPNTAPSKTANKDKGIEI